MKKAGIKVWVLTGDKIETAKTIGFSSNLLHKDMELLELTQESDHEIESYLHSIHRRICGGTSDYTTEDGTVDENSEITPLQPDSSLVEEREKALVVSGKTLIFIQKHDNLVKLLGQIGLKCQAVLCCRVSPKQKAEVVKMIRKALPDARTLSIGDGANDVNMIIEAHIGVGIKGVEGQQAARASDYSIGEFRHLKRLLVVYGRDSYRKNAILVLYTFWKNILIVFPQFWYALMFGNFSGMTLYEKFLYQFVNLIYTSLPIILYSVWDIEVHYSELERRPGYYKAGLRRIYFNFWLFMLWLVKGLMHAFFMMLFTSFLDFETESSGNNFNFWGVGMSVFLFGNIIANTNIFVISNSIFFLNVFVLIGSVLLLFISFIAISMNIGNLHFGLVGVLFTSPNFYQSLIASFVVVTMFDYIWDVAQRILFFEFLGIDFNTSDSEAKKKGKSKKKTGEESDVVRMKNGKIDIDNQNLNTEEDISEQIAARKPNNRNVGNKIMPVTFRKA